MEKNIKALEIKKAELIEKLGRLADSIIAERDTLANKIREAEADVAKFGQVRPIAANTEDIFNPEAILAAGEAETEEDKKKRLRLFARAYVTNPFCDPTKAAAALEILEELQQIAAELDSYYNGNVAKTAAALEQAKKDYKAATAARLQHQRSTNAAPGHIRRAASHDIIGYNDLARLGLDLFTFAPGEMGAGVGYNGAQIICGAIDAIHRKQEEADRIRKTPGRVERTVTTFKPSELQPGEPAADMTGFKRGGFNDFIANLTKK